MNNSVGKMHELIRWQTIELEIGVKCACLCVCWNISVSMCKSSLVVCAVCVFGN